MNQAALGSMKQQVDLFSSNIEAMSITSNYLNEAKKKVKNLKEPEPEIEESLDCLQRIIELTREGFQEVHACMVKILAE